jgi:hypothetical protein
VIELRIDQDVAGEEEHALVERGGQGSDVFGAHQRLAVEGEGRIGALGVSEARGPDDDGAVVVLVGSHLEVREAIFA